uniref:Uncharacterized protein n=1 Tax=Anguilla anguilla TaxID=7936 RepID=A0A0E9XP62_ANGAN
MLFYFSFLKTDIIHNISRKKKTLICSNYVKRHYIFSL